MEHSNTIRRIAMITAVSMMLTNAGMYAGAESKAKVAAVVQEQVSEDTPELETVEDAKSEDPAEESNTGNEQTSEQEQEKNSLLQWLEQLIKIMLGSDDASKQRDAAAEPAVNETTVKGQGESDGVKPAFIFTGSK